MRILLIHPPTNLYQGYLPLGLLYIAGYLLQRGHEITVWDIDAERWSQKEVLRKIEEEGGEYQLIGITALANDYPYVKWISKSFKKVYPESKLILGGYLATALPEFLMEKLPLDFVAVGEGEETMVELADALTSGSAPYHVKGIYFRDDSGKIVATPLRGRLKSLDHLPFPPYELFPMEAYLRDRSTDDEEIVRDNAKGIISIMASRGCPFDCNYCDHSIKGYKVRYRPVKSVIDEIKYLLAEYGDKIEQFYFWDDILIWDRDWTNEFCEALLRENLNIKWTCNCHVSRVEPRLMSYMKEAGCVNVRFGIESGSQKILDALHKDVKTKDALEALKTCMDEGLDLTIYLMVGMTGEDRETINETLQFFRELVSPLYAHQLNNINFFMFTPFPGTKIFEKIKDDGALDDVGKFFERGCDAYSDIPLNISGLTDNDLAKLKKDLERGALRIIKESRNQFNYLLADMAKEFKI